MCDDTTPDTRNGFPDHPPDAHSDRLPGSPLDGALSAAVRGGLLLVYPGEPTWTRLACPDCGGALDLPCFAGRLTGLDATGAARRVHAFRFRHRPGGAHR